MRPITHLHVCDCGRADMVCRQEPDHCDVPVRWTCPHCTSDQLEADLNHMESLDRAEYFLNRMLKEPN